LVCSTQSGRRSDWPGVLRSLEKGSEGKYSENDSTKLRVISRLARSTMLSKILTASALGGQFWIKDSARRTAACVLELGGAVSTEEASGLVHRPRDSVLRELSKSTEARSGCQLAFSTFVPNLAMGYLPPDYLRAGLPGLSPGLCGREPNSRLSAKFSKQRDDHV